MDDDWGVPLFQETSICINIDIFICMNIYIYVSTLDGILDFLNPRAQHGNLYIDTSIFYLLVIIVIYVYT